jgi:signal peptidase I
VSRFGLLDAPDIQGTEASAAETGLMSSTVTASVTAPYAIGLVGALPISIWRRRRGSRSD